MLLDMTDKTTTDRKSYAQYCPLARAMDVIGDRWTILLLRELLGGPASFQDLYTGLPGIAKNLLTTRLRRLEEDGIVRRVKQNTSSLYALTEQGASVRRALDEVAFWGAQLQPIAEPVHDRSVRAITMALQAILVRAGGRLPKQQRVVELQIDDHSVEVVLGPQPTASVRIVPSADARVTTSSDVMARYLNGSPVAPSDFSLASGDAAVQEALLTAMGVRG